MMLKIEIFKKTDIFEIFSTVYVPNHWDIFESDNYYVILTDDYEKFVKQFLLQNSWNLG